MTEQNKAKQLTTMAMIQNAIDELPHYILTCEYIAKTMRVKYDAFIKEGFTPEQDLFFVLG